MDETEDLLQLRPHRGHSAQLLERAGLRISEELADRHAVAVRPHGRIGGLEEIDQHLDHLFGGVALDLRNPALLGQHTRLPRRHAAERRDAHDDRRRRAHRDPVAPDELGHAIGRAVGPRQHRPAVEIALEVVGECVDRRVALVGSLLQRLQDDGVEIAPQEPPP